MPTDEELKFLHETKDFRDLQSHAGFQRLREVARKEVMAAWRRLTTAEIADIPRIQGFIEGAQFVLEYADARVTEADAIAERERADREEVLQARQAAKEQRGERRSRAWASL